MPEMTRSQQWWVSLTAEQQAEYIRLRREAKAQRRGLRPVPVLPEPWHRTVYYTDGSADPNPGPGGYAVVLHGVLVARGGERKTANNRMEGLAILAALRHSGLQLCEIRTDSMLWVNTLTKWAAGWERRGWRKRDGAGPANLDIVRAAAGALGRACVVWVPGHAGEPGNEAADEYAEQARRLRRPGTWLEFPGRADMETRKLEAGA